MHLVAANRSRSTPISRAVGKYILLLVICIGARAAAQSFYYISYQVNIAGKQPITHISFLRIQPDGSGIAKTRYKETASGREFGALELHYLDANEPSTEKKYLTLSDSLFISGDDSANFSVPRFVFQQLDNKQPYYGLSAVEYKASNGTWQVADSINIQQLGCNDLTPGFVAQFYLPDDAFYKDLFTPAQRGPSDIDKNTKFHLVVVANTLDSEIGQSTKTDSATMTDFFSAFVGKLGLTLHTYIISGKLFSKKAVLATLDKIKPTHSDVVVFYYSGHGFRYSNDSSIYPRISLRTSQKQDLGQNNLAIEDIYKHIKKMGARVTVVVSDCCNDDIGANVPVGMVIWPPPKPKVPPPLNYDNCMMLFFPAQPFSILCTSAEKNQLAAGNPASGGFFTSFFTAELEKNVYGKATGSSWFNVFTEASKSTTWKALSAPCGKDDPPTACGSNGRSIQRPDTNLMH